MYLIYQGSWIWFSLGMYDEVQIITFSKMFFLQQENISDASIALGQMKNSNGK